MFFEKKILAKLKKSDSNCLSPTGELWNRLERALDLSKNVSEPAKNDLGNSPLCNKYHKIQRSGQANPMPIGCIFICSTRDIKIIDSFHELISDSYHCQRVLTAIGQKIFFDFFLLP
jgi:hypothetical protein